VVCLPPSFAFDEPVNVVATPRADAPFYLTTTHALVKDHKTLICKSLSSLGTPLEKPRRTLHSIGAAERLFLLSSRFKVKSSTAAVARGFCRELS
jgi:hypothetical protein